MNDLDLCLEVVSRLRQPLRYIWRRKSRKPLTIQQLERTFHGPFQRTTNGICAFKWSRDWWRHVTLKVQTRDPNMLCAQYLESGWRQRLRSKGLPIGNGIWAIKWWRDWLIEHGFTSATSQYRLYGRRFLEVTWLMTSRDPQVLWSSMVGYPSDSFASCKILFTRARL